MFLEVTLEINQCCSNIPLVLGSTVLQYCIHYIKKYLRYCIIVADFYRPFVFQHYICDVGMGGGRVYN